MLDTSHVLGGVVGLPGLCALYALVSMLAIEINRCDVTQRVVLCTIDAKGNADLRTFAEKYLSPISFPSLSLSCVCRVALLCLRSSLSCVCGARFCDANIHGLYGSKREVPRSTSFLKCSLVYKFQTPVTRQNKYEHCGLNHPLLIRGLRQLPMVLKHHKLSNYG